jgi:hypothetical protein
MGHNFQWVRTTLELFPSFKMLEAVVIFPEVGPWEARYCRGLETRLLTEIEDRIAIETLFKGATPFCKLRKAVDKSWKVDVVVDWLGKVRVDSFYITSKK